LSQGNRPDRYRLFVALPVAEVAREAIAHAQAQIRRTLPEGAIRWTRPEQFHLTLQFLGDVGAPRVDPLIESLRAACKGFQPMHLRLRELGAFSNWRRPRVIWVGVEDSLHRLTELHHAVEAACSSFVFTKLRRTSDKDLHEAATQAGGGHAGSAVEEEMASHITLGRIKKLNRLEALTLRDAATAVSSGLAAEWTAGKVEIMRSVLAAEGAQHTLLAAISLAGQTVG
jgi:2'-5' RNA ligase